MLLEIYKTFTQEQYEKIKKIIKVDNLIIPNYYEKRDKIKKIDELIISNDWDLMSITDKNEQYEELKKLIEDFGDNKKVFNTKVLSYCFEKLQENIRCFGVELPIEKESIFKELAYKIKYYKILNECILSNLVDKFKVEEFEEYSKILKQLCGSKKTYQTVLDNIINNDSTLKPFIEKDKLLKNLIDNIEICSTQISILSIRFFKSN